MEEQIQTENVVLKEPKIIFEKYDIANVSVKDMGLKAVINLDYKPILKSQGRVRTKYYQDKINIIERFGNLITLSGHRGKKHKVEIGKVTGKYEHQMRTVLAVFEILEKQTGKNPIQILVTAIENAAPRDEVTAIEYGGARYPQAVDVSPLRRVSLALRNIVRGASDKAFGKKKKLAQALAEEVKLAYDLNMESAALKKKNEVEKQADSAR